MPNTSIVRRTLDAISDAVALELAPIGWRRRTLGRPLGLDTFTRDVGSGVLATMNLFFPLISLGTAWPSELPIDVGVDFEPALDVAPLLTLPVLPMLVRAPAPDGRRNGEVSVAGGGADQRAQAVREIVTVYATQADAFARGFDATEILAVMRRGIDAGGGEWWHQRHLAMLVALGRHGEVHDALATYEQRFASEPRAARARRFARQVRRRATESPSDIPPVEETLAVLPPPRRMRDLPKRDFRNGWQRSRATRSATKAVEVRADGRSLTELRAMLTREYATRGLPAQSIGVAIAAEYIAAGRSRFGRVERGLHVAAAVTGAVVQLVQVFTQPGSTANPDWLMPPERAAYRVEASDDHVVAVRIDDGLRAYLDRALAEGHHLGSLAQVPVWLTTPDSPVDAVRVHLGARPIGVVAATAAASFASAFRAAALFDEDVTLEARMYRTIDGIHLVELPTGTLWSVDAIDQPDIDDDETVNIDF
jgi:hypothetical protein